MFTLTTNSPFDQLERLIDRIAKPGNGQTRALADGIRQQFQANFTRQGSGAGAWAALAPSTARQRQQQGYAGNRPILVRTGQLRASFVDRGAADHYERIWQSAVGLTVEVGSDDPRAIFHERGTSRMPARPVTLLDDAQGEALFRLVDFVVVQTERQFWR